VSLFLHFFTSVELRLSSIEFASRMTADTLIPTTADGVTERFDPIACLDERVRHRALAAPGASTSAGAPPTGRPIEHGRYIEIQGPERTLLIPLGTDVVRVGRGLAADLHLDDISVSRRHAIVVPRRSGARILDDRSANGTFVNGRRVQQAELHGGDVIVLGRVVLRFLEL
jgi:Inner membrane component of T3SS, cytoplasmic domain